MQTPDANQSPRRRAWLRFRRNGLAMAGLGFIALMVLVALLGPWIRPDGTPQTNAQQIVLSNQSPGFTVEVVRLHKPNFTPASFWETLAHYGAPEPYTEIAIQTATAKDGGLACTLYGSEDKAFYSADQLYAPAPVSRRFLLGTDKFGRDLLSRLMAGTLISLSVGLIAVGISLLIGVVFGALAGYFGGWVDRSIMWLINVIWSVPTLLLVLAMVLAFGKGFEKVFIAVGLTMWVEVARVVRGQILSLREREYAQAARVLGYGHLRILFGHLLPGVWGPVIVISAANFASAILIEAGLSFLGIGAQIPTPSWGNMIKEHYSYITTDLAYLAFIPGVMIMALVLAFMLVGNGLRDALDVRASG